MKHDWYGVGKLAEPVRDPDLPGFLNFKADDKSLLSEDADGKFSNPRFVLERHVRGIATPPPIPLGGFVASQRERMQCQRGATVMVSMMSSVGWTTRYAVVSSVNLERAEFTCIYDNANEGIIDFVGDAKWQVMRRPKGAPARIDAPLP